MSWFLSHNFDQKRAHLEARMKIIKNIRSTFDEQGFWEVETPVLQVCPTFDLHIHGIPAGKDQYLRTSPELDMKKLMVAGVENLYQIGSVFRDEPKSKTHNPEFTMLEWYRTGKDYRALIEDCRTILRSSADLYTYGDKSCDPSLNLNINSIVEIFDKYIKIDLMACLQDTQKFAALLGDKGVRTTPDDTWEDLFHAAMAEKIEPHLGVGAPTIIYDYPISMASLARPKPEDPRFAERMELYVCGVELANGFSELTDPKIQRDRFDKDMNEKNRLHGVSYKPDEEFFAALGHGLPESTGMALGLDRLVMLATGARDIKDVLWCA
ncbi:EF-P lysine aminoacylase EpmA [Alphaproteobacteria bacterium]|nr:EF-P lysine aminoacylase EpmA [Alphaproteobacteria bacterium]